MQSDFILKSACFQPGGGGLSLQVGGLRGEVCSQTVSPSTAGMMLLATIGVGEDTAALAGYDGTVPECLRG